MIIIPMAGESRRFREAGYDRPKYKLPLAGRPLFDWSVLSFEAEFLTSGFLFITRDIEDTPRFVADRVGRLGIRNATVVVLEAPTSGQAETVAFGLAKSATPDVQQITIFNIDTIRPRYESPTQKWLENKAGWLEVFTGEGDGWSFVDPDPSHPELVLRTSEKERISTLCCTGMYGFRSRALFEEALAQERVKPSHKELYVAPTYNHLIRSGWPVGYREVSSADVMFSGVPAEYEALKRVGGLQARF